MMDLQNWSMEAPKRLRSDPLWKSKYYQLAMFLYDLTWEDCNHLSKDFRGKEVSRQLI